MIGLLSHPGALNLYGMLIDCTSTCSCSHRCTADCRESALPVVQQLLAIAAPRIVYVSCNPATQARDLQWLSVKYNVLISQPVDMFPQTSHVENVVLLELKIEKPEGLSEAN